MRTITIPPGSIDHHLRTYRQAGTRFVLESGEYTTQGTFAFAEHDLCMIPPGCALIGAGRHQTTIRVVSPVMEHEGKATRYYEALTGGARTASNSVNLQVQGFTLDLDPTVPCVGIHLWTSGALVRDVVVQGVFGSRTHSGPVKEGFGILVNNAARQSVDGGHQIEDCAVLPAVAPNDGENYCTGIYVGAVNRAMSRMLPSFVRACSVVGDGISMTHAAFAANALTTFDQCYAHRVARAFFCDTGRVNDIVVDRMHAARVVWALDLRVAWLGEAKRFVSVRRSRFDFQPADSPEKWVQAVLLADESLNPGQTPIENIELLGCRFVAPKVGQASKGRCRGDVSGVIESGCRWVGEWQPPVLQGEAKLWEVVS